MEVDGKKQNILSCKSIARHELTLNLYDLIRNAKRLLKPMGSITLVHRSYRFTDISRILEDCGFSLKRVRFIYYSKDRNSNLVLVEAFKITLVHRSYRFTDISRILEDCGFSLKRVRFIYYSKDRNSNLVLVEAFKGKKCKLEIEPPLFLEECGY